MKQKIKVLQTNVGRNAKERKGGAIQPNVCPGGPCEQSVC